MDTGEAFSDEAQCKGDTLSAILAMLAGGTMVFFVKLQAQESREPWGCMVAFAGWSGTHGISSRRRSCSVGYASPIRIHSPKNDATV